MFGPTLCNFLGVKTWVPDETTKFWTTKNVPKLLRKWNRGHYMTPTQTRHYKGEIPQNLHIFWHCLIPPKWVIYGNLMIPVKPPVTLRAFYNEPTLHWWPRWKPEISIAVYQGTWARRRRNHRSVWSLPFEARRFEKQYPLIWPNAVNAEALADALNLDPFWRTLWIVIWPNGS